FSEGSTTGPMCTGRDDLDRLVPIRAATQPLSSGTETDRRGDPHPCGSDRHTEPAHMGRIGRSASVLSTGERPVVLASRWGVASGPLNERVVSGTGATSSQQ